MFHILGYRGGARNLKRGEGGCKVGYSGSFSRPGVITCFTSSFNSTDSQCECFINEGTCTGVDPVAT